ncbi:hypothetical protein GCM10022221_63370 [Actinocorallia aurea]
MTGRSGDLVAGRYRLTVLLGEGGMGSAWKACDERLGREVAVKQLRLPPGLDGQARAQRVAWMEREARAAAVLRHPGIITVHDQFHDEDGMPWIVMELIDGHSLDQRVKDVGRLSAEHAARIGAQVADALAAAHAAGIVHRDLKPANILLDGSRTVLMDFGIAALDGATTLTPTGGLLGTPTYMAPEQVNGQHATPASDMWSLGATLYYAVEGRPAFTGPTTAALLLAVSRGEPRPTVHAGSLRPLLDDLMTKEPERRPTAERTAAALRQHTAVPPQPPQAFDAGATPFIEPGSLPRPQAARSPLLTRRRLILGLGTVGLATAVPTGYLLTRDQRPPDPRWNPTPTPTPTFISRLLANHIDVNSVAFSPDGKTLATSNSNHTVRLWNVASRTPIGRLLTGHTDRVTSVAFSPDGRTLATGSWDDTVRLWNVATRTPIGEPLTGHTDDVFSVAFSPDGRTLASGSDDETVRLWSVASGTPIGRPLTGHAGWVWSVAFSPDGRTLATGSRDDTVRLWNVATRTPIGEPLTGHTDQVWSVAFSPDGQTLASGSDDDTVRLWNVASGTPIDRPLTGHTDAVTSVAFSADGRTLATGSSDHTVRLWNVATRTPIGEPLTGHTDQVWSVAFSPDGQTLATSSWDDTVRLWSP